MKLEVFIIICVLLSVNGEEKKVKSWKDKDIMDMTDADMERLLDQWEEGEEPLEDDELPEHLRPAPKIDLSQIDPTNPDNLLRATKQGKNVMMFVDVRDELSDTEADGIMKIWQGSLQNNHIVAERYPIESKRSIFMFREGSQAVDAKNYLIDQPELKHVTLEGNNFPGNHIDKEYKSGTKKTKSGNTEL
ncbi:LDLR chaperone boca [Fopius arisanus]|uniref:LDLR chaperone boca n=1 Tax=Fopius arisanus TaxID=64838 RepID=A0A9R1T661_9HYME|nr:PREDICTED: LDLR chaperone boca [Fopius arisanus]